MTEPVNHTRRRIPLGVLPHDCKKEIFSFLSKADLIAAMCASRFFQALANSNQVWESFTRADGLRGIPFDRNESYKEQIKEIFEQTVRGVLPVLSQTPILYLLEDKKYVKLGMGFKNDSIQKCELVHRLVAENRLVADPRSIINCNLDAYFQSKEDWSPESTKIPYPGGFPQFFHIE